MKHVENNMLQSIIDSITDLDQAKTDAKMLLAIRIAEAMEENGLKKIELMERIGKTSPSIITKWLSGTHNFTVDTLVEIEHALDISLLNLSRKNTIQFTLSPVSNPQGNEEYVIESNSQSFTSVSSQSFTSVSQSKISLVA